MANASATSKRVVYVDHSIQAVSSETVENHTWALWDPKKSAGPLRAQAAFREDGSADGIMKRSQPAASSSPLYSRSCHRVHQTLNQMFVGFETN